MRELKVDFIFQESPDTAEVFCCALTLQPGRTGMFFYQIKDCLAKCEIFKSWFVKKEAQTCFAPGVRQGLYSFSSTDVGRLPKH